MSKMHPEDTRARYRRPGYDRDYYRSNKERLRKNLSLYLTRRKLEVINHYGGRCACCGEDQIYFLTIDHINGDGAEQRKEVRRTGVRMYTWLFRNGFPEGFQVLCYNCNCAKGTNPTCPHKYIAEMQDYSI